MNEDYLWDRSGRPDPEIERLERLLRPLGHGATPTAPASPLRPRAEPRRAATPSAPPAVRPLGLPLAAGVLLALVAGLVWSVQRGTTPAPAWNVDRLAGTPTIAARVIGDRGQLRVGTTLETSAGARARIDVADIGFVEVEPGSRVELVRSDADEHRLRLDRGRLHALIFAPPGRFIVDTPSSTAIDLGCAYTLEVDEHGAGHVDVTSGWVGFEFGGRESFIPAGAMCQTRPGIGPGTPHYGDVSAPFQEALAVLDFSSLDDDRRVTALDRVLDEARPADGLTLWHLLTRGTAGERARVHDRLAELVPRPKGATRDGILAGDSMMLDAWWETLGLGDVGEWRRWTQQWQGDSR